MSTLTSETTSDLTDQIKTGSVGKLNKDLNANEINNNKDYLNQNKDTLYVVTGIWDTYSSNGDNDIESGLELSVYRLSDDNQQNYMVPIRYFSLYDGTKGGVTNENRFTTPKRRKRDVACPPAPKKER